MMDYAGILPPEFPTLRVCRAADARKIATWIEAGRAGGVFRRGPRVTVRRLQAYREEFEKAGRSYHCWLIGNDLGYMDVCFEDTRGEVLGIYLEPSTRRARLGRHLLRVATSWLRERGCRSVRAEIYADNEASLRAHIAAGFEVHRRFLDGDRPTLELRRAIPALLRMSPPDPSYARLRGDNLVHQHYAVAEAVAEALGQIAGVELVLGLGSLFRGFADTNSDVDLMVLGRGSRVRSIPTGEHFAVGTSLDVFAVDLGSAPPRTWDLGRRQAVEESVVLHRTRGVSIASLRREVALERKERLARIADALFHLGWIGFHPRRWTGQRKLGYLWSVPCDVWLQRGSVASAHATVDAACDLALQLLYLVNGRYPADPKWRRFLAEGLPISPRGWPEPLDRLDRIPRDASHHRERADIVLDLVEWCVGRLERTERLSDDLYSRFVRRCPDYLARR